MHDNGFESFDACEILLNCLRAYSLKSLIYSLNRFLRESHTSARGHEGLGGRVCYCSDVKMVCKQFLITANMIIHYKP